MRLRKQLFFLSLITLSLPWVGVQYVREMDGALRKGQSDALAATAMAVAARLSSDPNLIEEFSSPQDTHAYYAHVLRSSLILDGYGDDWTSHDIRLLEAPQSPTFEYALARNNNTLFAFIKANTGPVRYFDPSSPQAVNSDHIELVFGNGKHIALYASAPGQLSAARYEPENPILLSKNAIHDIRGHWIERRNGFQIEWQMPLQWAKQGLAMRRINAGEQPLDNAFVLSPLLSISGPLTSELQVFASPSTRLYIASKQHNMIAKAGNISLVPEAEKQHGFLEWLYSFVLSKRFSTALDRPQTAGEFTTQDVLNALKGQPGIGWYRSGSQSIARFSVPIKSNEGIVGAVVAEQNADTLGNLTNSVFSRLLAYSFLISCGAALSLVIYATWLSVRIKRLSHAAANAISESGKVTESFPVSNSADEIGELSRSFAQLLSRLREYTNYLRTLSSKLSHELRTPLAIVKSSLDNLEHEKLSKQAKIYAERAREGSARLSNILNSMSAASRVEQAIGAAELEMIPCDELLSSLKDAYEDVYQHVKFSLRIQPHKGGLKMLGAGELIVQLLDKLVDNAADFCPENGLIELGLYKHDDMIVFTVRNEGPPLPKHMQNQLFDSMVSVREDASPEEKGHHLGLGLYIVRLIADFHRGEVQGYNVPDNSGVIFEVRFPTNT